MKTTTYTAICGFATGAPKQGNATWFTIRKESEVSIKDAMLKCLREAYSNNQDICADWVFSAHINGKLCSGYEDIFIHIDRLNDL